MFVDVLECVASPSMNPLLADQVLAMFLAIREEIAVFILMHAAPHNCHVFVKKTKNYRDPSCQWALKIPITSFWPLGI